MMKNARKLYSVISLAEAVTWTLLILGMIAKYVLQLGDIPVRISGSLHGFVFLVFVVTTWLTAVNNRWNLGQLLLGLASAIIPWATLAFDYFAHRKGMVREDWRFYHPNFTAQTLSERIVAFIVRRPVLSVLLILIAVVAVFSLLLWLGPPTEWANRF